MSRDWTKRRAAPAGRRGYMDLKTFLPWVKERMEELERGTGQSEDEMLKRIKRKREELGYEKDLKKVVERDKALRAVERGITEARGTLEALPSRLSSAIGPDGQHDREELLEIARETVEKALKSLAECKKIEE